MNTTTQQPWPPDEVLAEIAAKQPTIPQVLERVIKIHLALMHLSIYPEEMDSVLPAVIEQVHSLRLDLAGATGRACVLSDDGFRKE